MEKAFSPQDGRITEGVLNKMPVELLKSVTERGFSRERQCCTMMRSLSPTLKKLFSGSTFGAQDVCTPSSAAETKPYHPYIENDRSQDAVKTQSRYAVWAHATIPQLSK